MNKKNELNTGSIFDLFADTKDEIKSGDVSMSEIIGSAVLIILVVGMLGSVLFL